MGGIGTDAGGHSITRVGDVIYGMDNLVARWVAKRIPSYQVSPGSRAIGIAKGDDLVAGVVYERWNGVHIEASIAAERGSAWASRSALFAMFYYPFVTLNCEAISVLVPASNLESMNLATKLGFEPEALIKYAAHDGSTLVVLKQFREQCRWLRHGQGKQRASAPRSAGDGAS